MLPELECSGEHAQFEHYTTPKDAKEGMTSVYTNQQGTCELLEHSQMDIQVPGTNVGTVASIDMLILHENSTLPLSDACSKSVSIHV